MNISRIKLFDLLLLILSLLALFIAIGLALFYVNEDNPQDVLFILRRDTYDKIFSFLLGTVAVGGFALTYSRFQRAKEKRIAYRRMVKTKLYERVQRLQEVYETVLVFFQNVKLQRRRMRGGFIAGSFKGGWKMRRGLYEEVVFVLNQAQLEGEKILKTLDFERDALAGGGTPNDEELKRLEKLRIDLKSQIGGIQGILRNVLKTAEWQSVTDGTTNDEDLVTVPQGLVRFADSRTKGNTGFRKVAEHFDAFAKNIITRIRELESETILYDEVEF